MALKDTEYFLDQFRALPPERQLEIATEIDRLTWNFRWQRICERIADRARRTALPSDAEIDEIVRDVRRERPLSER